MIVVGPLFLIGLVLVLLVVIERVSVRDAVVLFLLALFVLWLIGGMR